MLPTCDETSKTFLHKMEGEARLPLGWFCYWWWLLTLVQNLGQDKDITYKCTQKPLQQGPYQNVPRGFCDLNWCFFFLTRQLPKFQGVKLEKKKQKQQKKRFPQVFSQILSTLANIYSAAGSEESSELT